MIDAEIHAKRRGNAMNRAYDTRDTKTQLQQLSKET